MEHIRCRHKHYRRILDAVNFFKKIKNTFSSKKKKGHEHIGRKVCNAVLPVLSARISPAPADLNQEEWNLILKKIEFAFTIKQQRIYLKSPAKIKIQKKKVEEGFRLFEIYFNQL